MAWSDAAREASIMARQASATGPAAHQAGISALRDRSLDKFEEMRDQQRAYAHHLALRRQDDDVVEFGRRSLGISRHLNAPLAPGERDTPRSDVAYRHRY